MSKVRAGSKASARERIVEGAAVLFSSKGYSATSLQDIADSLEVTRPALYYYFSSKEEILRALMEGDAQVAAKLIQDIRSQPEGTVVDRLEGAVTTFVSWVLRRRNIFKIMERLDSDLPQEMLERQKLAKRQVLQEFSDLVAEGIASGDFADLGDKRKTALALIGMCTWSAWWYSEQKDGPVEETAEYFGRLAVRMLSASSMGREERLEIQSVVYRLEGILRN